MHCEGRRRGGIGKTLRRYSWYSCFRFDCEIFTELFDRMISFYRLEREGPGLAPRHMWLRTLYCVQGKGSCQHQIIVQSYTLCGRLAFFGGIHAFLVAIMHSWWQSCILGAVMHSWGQSCIICGSHALMVTVMNHWWQSAVMHSLWQSCITGGSHAFMVTGMNQWWQSSIHGDSHVLLVVVIHPWYQSCIIGGSH